MSAPNRFWMVWGEGTRGSTCQHETLLSAQAEAERLATQDPGVRYYVLAAVSENVAKTIVTWRAVKPADITTEVDTA